MECFCNSFRWFVLEATRNRNDNPYLAIMSQKRGTFIFNCPTTMTVDSGLQVMCQNLLVCITTDDHTASHVQFLITVPSRALVDTLQTTPMHSHQTPTGKVSKRIQRVYSRKLFPPETLQCERRNDKGATAERHEQRIPQAGPP